MEIALYLCQCVGKALGCASIRDTLLPKLLSGEIRIKDTEDN